MKRADLNGDGKEDFVLDTGSVNCDGAASIYGDREKWVGVYVGDGKGGATSAFIDSVYGVTIEGTGSAARLWLTVSGEQCGKKPAKDFASENFCDRADPLESGDEEVRLRARGDGADDRVDACRALDPVHESAPGAGSPPAPAGRRRQPAGGAGCRACRPRATTSSPGCPATSWPAWC